MDKLIDIFKVVKLICVLKCRLKQYIYKNLSEYPYNVACT